MKHDHFVQSPDKPAKQLLLLFHGVSDAINMGELVAGLHLFSEALIVSIGGVEAVWP